MPMPRIDGKILLLFAGLLALLGWTGRQWLRQAQERRNERRRWRVNGPPREEV